MKKKTLSVICAILFAGILTLTAGIGSSWFTNGDIKTWFNSWGKSTTVSDNSNGNKLDNGEVKNPPVVEDNKTEKPDDGKSGETEKPDDKKPEIKYVDLQINVHDMDEDKNILETTSVLEPDENGVVTFKYKKGFVALPTIEGLSADNYTIKYEYHAKNETEFYEITEEEYLEGLAGSYRFTIEFKIDGYERVSENPVTLVIESAKVSIGGLSLMSTDENSGIELHDTKFCSVCGSLMQKSSSITPGFCDTNSGYDWFCTDMENCGNVELEEIPNTKDPDNHRYFQYTRDIASATCLNEGTALFTCTGCGETIIRSMPATGVHSYEWVITTYPEGDTAGIESYKCKTCTSVTQTRSFFALPEEPEKEGYHFVGWYTDEDLTIPYEGERIYDNISLYAKFAINECVITFDSDGGSEINQITVVWNTSINPVVPEKEGYNFLGWYLPDGTKYEEQVIKDDTTLTAHWQIKTFTVTFYVNDKVYATVTVNYGSVLSKVADDLGLFAKNILSFENVNTETPEVYASEMYISDDVVVYANEPTLFQKIFQPKYLPWEIGGLCALIIIGVIVGVVEKKKRG